MIFEVEVKDVHAPVLFYKDRWLMKKVGPRKESKKKRKKAVRKFSCLEVLL
jgi:hypothetical protein